ncbi:helix-turn-helix domain-containing protein [Myxococcus landrumensis]|uniref:Helix-turn-helix transcriptional regulator n=1 Tax=Myxococcus landrumensis TaxID=2813577 RepID=A0ABX7N869_9BACT|nr:AraC family transcriptional regulator [Myxococcus landrumus]QSQ13855.1 helix-turn-helix transcriptional regulator [Myxococcus landrumus]
MTASHAAQRVERPFTSAFAAQLESRVLQRPNLLVGEFRSDAPDTLITGVVPRDDAYVLTLHLRERPRGDMRAENRCIQPRNFHAGHAGIVDLRSRLSSEYAGPFHYVSIYLKRPALGAYAEDAGARRLDELHHQPGVGFSDPVVQSLLLSLRPALAAPDEVSTLYADHVALALVTHLADSYGAFQAARTNLRGGLSPVHLRRVKELMDAHLDGSVSLGALARACGLSERHFARAFRETTGQPPHQWLMARRLEKARHLLESSSQSLSEIAGACGFAHQSHFTRSFTRALGTSPGVWRRQRLS